MSNARFDLRRQAGRGDQVVQHVADGDRLDPVLEPLRRDHRRQPVGEVAQHLEAGRPRPDDHGRLQHRRGHARGHQQVADLDPGGQVLAQLDALRVQAGQVDGAADVLGLRGQAELAGELGVPLGEARLPVHRVQQVVGDVDTAAGLLEHQAAVGVALDDVDPRGPRPRLHLGRRPGEHADRPPGVEQPGHHPGADVPRGAGHQRETGHERTSIRPGSTNSMLSDHVTWVIIGPRTPPVTRRSRPTTRPSTAAAKTSMRFPVVTVTSV